MALMLPPCSLCTDCPPPHARVRPPPQSIDKRRSSMSRHALWFAGCRRLCFELQTQADDLSDKLQLQQRLLAAAKGELTAQQGAAQALREQLQQLEADSAVIGQLDGQRREAIRMLVDARVRLADTEERLHQMSDLVSGRAPDVSRRARSGGIK